MKIGIVLVATNAYFVLGVRFIKKFLHHYKGDAQIKFFFFSDTDPNDYVDADIHYIHTVHNSWVDGTNSKFVNIISLEPHLHDTDYLYYFDADTNVSKDFTEAWFLGDLVGGQHYADQDWMKERKGFDRNPRSKAYVPENTPLPQMYYYGAFFGGNTANMVSFCKVLRENQLEDKKINYEPGVNDESYINQYFHYNPPTKVVYCTDFKFDISDKGGLGQTRNTKLDTDFLKKVLIINKDKLFELSNNNIIWLK